MLLNCVAKREKLAGADTELKNVFEEVLMTDSAAATLLAVLRTCPAANSNVAGAEIDAGKLLVEPRIIDRTPEAEALLVVM
jgi:hypothetical protein